MWDFPRPGLEPVSPALADRFLTTAPPGKPWQSVLAPAFKGFPSQMEKRWQIHQAVGSFLHGHTCYTVLSTFVYLSAKPQEEIPAPSWGLPAKLMCNLVYRRLPLVLGCCLSLHSPRTAVFTFPQTLRLPGPSAWVSASPST